MCRDFTWVQSLGILFGSHYLFIGALETSAWDDTRRPPLPLPRWRPHHPPSTRGCLVALQDHPTYLIHKDSWIHNHGITDEDCFTRLDLSFKFCALSGDVSGVLGQTYARNHVSWAKMCMAMPVLGGEREFASSGLFTTDCMASWFIGQLAPWNSAESFEFADLECAGRVEGRGVVRKR
ncbi:hypothetical protein NL676_004724 [Syzygium grande]|nr:hypothetical protein NL676_004724 [Syzygium grande]